MADEKDKKDKKDAKPKGEGKPKDAKAKGDAPAGGGKKKSKDKGGDKAATAVIGEAEAPARVPGSRSTTPRRCSPSS
jgi:hypothetical protein